MATSTIACNCVSLGALSKLLIETSGDGTTARTFSGSSLRYEFVYETLATERRLKHTNAITGALGKRLYGVRTGSYMTQGVIALQMSPLQLDSILPLVLGGTKSGTSFPLTNSVPSFDAMVYREAGIFQYRNLRVAQAIIRGKSANGGEAPEFIELMLVCVGEEEIITEDGGSSSWPATEPELSTSANTLPYIFPEMDLDINSSAYNCESFTLTIDNMLMVKWFDALYPQCIRSTGRHTTLDLELPFTCDGLAEILSLHETAGTATVSFETPTGAPTFSTSFEMSYARSNFKSPTAQGRQDIPLNVRIEGFDSSGNDSLVVTNDSVA